MGSRPRPKPSQALGSSSNRWSSIFTGRLRQIATSKKAEEAMASREAVRYAMNLLGVQFERHIERVEKIFSKLHPRVSDRTDYENDLYVAKFAQIYVALFLEHQLNLEISDKDFMKKVNNLDNFQALNALKLKKDPKLIKAMKRLKPRKKKKKK